LRKADFAVVLRSILEDLKSRLNQRAMKKFLSDYSDLRSAAASIIAKHRSTLDVDDLINDAYLAVSLYNKRDFVQAMVRVVYDEKTRCGCLTSIEAPVAAERLIGDYVCAHCKTPQDVSCFPRITKGSYTCRTCLSAMTLASKRRKREREAVFKEPKVLRPLPAVRRSRFTESERRERIAESKRRYAARKRERLNAAAIAYYESKTLQVA
jgi:hypothetical protein